MKLPLLNILRTSKVFAVVLGLHLFVLSLLLFHPGCQRTNPTTTSEPAAPMGEVTAMDNATLAEPTRPADSANTTLNDTTAASSTIGTSVVSNELPPAPVPSMTTYTVQHGDSLWSIARKNGVSVNALLDANNLTRNSILKTGQSLKIPAATSAPASTSTVASSDETPSAAGTYKVKAGDSLGKIAREHGVSVRALKATNKIHGNTIRVGQVLKIPSGSAATADTSTASTKHHSAKKEAASSSTSTDTAAPSVNSDSSSASTSTSTATVDAASTSTDASYSTHKVEKGESPAVIAHKYGMKTSELLALNNISDPRKLQVGQELKIKADAPSTDASASTTSTDASASATSADTKTPVKSMSVEALEAATSASNEAAAPVVEVKPASTLAK